MSQTDDSFHQLVCQSPNDQTIITDVSHCHATDSTSYASVAVGHSHNPLWSSSAGSVYTVNGGIHWEDPREERLKKIEQSIEDLKNLIIDHLLCGKSQSDDSK